MTEKTAVLTLNFRSWWVSGTGGGRGRHLDAVGHRDADGLPAMPMSQVKGTLRETAERLALAGRAGWCNTLVKQIFGARTDAGGASSEGAVAFLGDAEIPACDRKGLVGAGKCARRRRGELYRRIAATQVGERGAALDRTLRYVEAAAPVRITGHLEWVSGAAPHSDWITLLDAACAATLAFGKLKLDGYGAAIASVNPAQPSAAPTASIGGFSHSRRVHVLLEQTRPAVFSRNAATEGAHATLDAPTGGALLGWAAAAGRYGKFKEKFKVFHSGAVRFGNAMPLGPDGTVCVPTPKLFMAPKHEAGSGEKHGKVAETVRIGRPPPGGQDEAIIQYEHAPGAPFITPTGCVVSPARGQRLRTATRRRRAAEGMLFGYEHLSGEKRPVFVATLERDDTVCNDDWALLLAAFEGQTARLGRARGTSYGGDYACRILDAPQNPETVQAGTKGRLRVLALSDLALADEFGVPCAEPDHEMLGLPPARFVGGDSAMSLRRHAPWNAKIQARDTERQTIEAGSVLSFDLDEPLKKELPAQAAVGLWREAGFGQIWISPPFLQDLDSGAPRFEPPGERIVDNPDDGGESTSPSDESDGDSDLAKWCDIVRSHREVSDA